MPVRGGATDHPQTSPSPRPSPSEGEGERQPRCVVIRVTIPKCVIVIFFPTAPPSPTGSGGAGIVRRNTWLSRKRKAGTGAESAIAARRLQLLSRKRKTTVAGQTYVY